MPTDGIPGGGASAVECDWCGGYYDPIFWCGVLCAELEMPLALNGGIVERLILAEAVDGTPAQKDGKTIYRARVLGKDLVKYRTTEVDFYALDGLPFERCQELAKSRETKHGFCSIEEFEKLI